MTYDDITNMLKAGLPLATTISPKVSLLSRPSLFFSFRAVTTCSQTTACISKSARRTWNSTRIKKDQAGRKLEDILTVREIPWEKSEVWIDSRR